MQFKNYMFVLFLFTLESPFKANAVISWIDSIKQTKG